MRRPDIWLSTAGHVGVTQDVAPRAATHHGAVRQCQPRKPGRWRRRRGCALTSREETAGTATTSQDPIRLPSHVALRFRMSLLLRARASLIKWLLTRLGDRLRFVFRHYTLRPHQATFPALFHTSVDPPPWKGQWVPSSENLLTHCFSSCPPSSRISAPIYGFAYRGHGPRGNPSHNASKHAQRMTKRPPVFTSRYCRLISDQLSILGSTTSRRNMFPRLYAMRLSHSRTSLGRNR